MAGQLVEHDDLVGVDPGQTVGRQAPHGVEQPGLRGVSEPIEAGAVQPGSGVTVVEELCHQLMSLSCSPFDQRCPLGADRSPGLLGFGRDPAVDGHSHSCASLVMTNSSGGASSSS